MTTLAPQSAARIVRGMSFEDYCADPALNASLAKQLLISPAHYKAALTAQREETMAMQIGTYLHGYVLTGELPKYVIKPEGMSFATKDGKAWKAAQTATILTQAEANSEVRMCNAIADSARARKLLEDHPEREVSVFATFRDVPIKCRMDAASFDSGSIVDVKKARSGNPRGFGKACADLDYFFSAVWYQLCMALHGGREIARYRWLVVEDSDAAPVEVYKLTEAQHQLGWWRVNQAIDLFKACTASGEWPCSGTAVWPELDEGEERTCVTPRWYEQEGAL